MTEETAHIVETYSIIAEYCKLLESREKLTSILEKITNKSSQLYKDYTYNLYLLDSAIALETKMLYIESVEMCTPTISKFLANRTKEPEKSGSNVISLIDKST